MSLEIYNTMSRSKETFEPMEPGKVNMYVCGPTVYDYIHIGNARPVIFFDVVRRYLEAVGYEVNYIVNFTDVDDKLIRKAEQLGTTVPEVAERFIAAFNEDIAGLGVRKATLNPRVTGNIDEIIAFVQGLVDKGLAYESEGDVYFRTLKFPGYGKLSHQNMEELQFGIRIEVGDRKENPQDFVLWKGAKPGEIYWDSPWGQGRPGWHIECSAMARKYLGDTLDIHGGGHDLQFPHHECEIAQSESLTGEPLARYWMHNGFININNEKMSKSLGNGVIVHDLLKAIKPAAIRYFMLSAHYRSPLNFSDDTIAQAENSVERIANCRSNLEHRLAALGTSDCLDAAIAAEEPAPAEKGLRAVRKTGEAELDAKLDALAQQFIAKMDDDFNTPDAITAVFDTVAEANLYLQRPVVSAQAVHSLLDLLLAMDEVLGLLPAQEEGAGLLDEEIDRLIEERTQARKAKNWARADEIRDTLAEQGIVLEDTPQGIRWRRK
ncbi:cysteine--tRNA ligase [Paenibacillus beijingensis]|uniref:Cysteine--tRNA ligase n=1 Tax=Paenibacillus beijingensis TaxID=1126833 RepID=A0A0D5NJH2_9BACL|nr:cysteine--tRNA ligase [Paenibacillus beijingensis]AJY75250.1 cysteinyl-tRNA synthetase [Paenibacillus beijingensis]